MMSSSSSESRRRQLSLSHDDPRTQVAVDLLLLLPTDDDPTIEEKRRSVPAAMRAAGFTMEESRDRARQMRVRRRVPPRRRRRVEPSSSAANPPAAAAGAVGSSSDGASSSNANGPRGTADDDDENDDSSFRERCSLRDWILLSRHHGRDENDDVRTHLERTAQILYSLARKWKNRRGGGVELPPPPRLVGGRHEEDGDDDDAHREKKGGGRGRTIRSRSDFFAVENIVVGTSSSATVPMPSSSGRRARRRGGGGVPRPRRRFYTADFISWGDDDASPFCRECREVDGRGRCHSDDDEDDEEDAAGRDASSLARIAYAMCLRGRGPRLPDFLPRHSNNDDEHAEHDDDDDVVVDDVASPPEASSLAALRLGENNDDDDEEGGGGISANEEAEIMDMFRKQFRAAEHEERNNDDGNHVRSAMLDAGIPLPMRRFIIDLLGDEKNNNDGMLRSERSFSSFEDVISDLEQMVMNPDRFLHGDHSDRWKIVFDDNLYGREAEVEALLIAADRVVTRRVEEEDDDDARSDRLYRLAGKKSEVVLVSGHSGAGKSRLVRLAGVSLEENGWIFLRCKFDRVAHPEPLSVLTHSLDAYLRSLALCPMHGIYRSSAISSHASMQCTCLGRSQGVRARLKHAIFPQGLGMLAKHIPSLKLLMGVAPTLDSPGLNESMMISLFRKLLQAISSKQSPILFFLDDLQWADSLSLSMLVEIVKEASPDLNSSVTDIIEIRINDLDEKAYIMFVGSYRDNEVDSTHPLAKVHAKFRDDNSIEMTEISLLGLSRDALNEMLSDTLSLPVRRVRPLSELVIQKTGGHPLHVIEFIQALSFHNLLTHSFARGWEWDADSIDIFPISDSVAELYSCKLRRLPIDILLGLQILSCFGFQVNQQVLDFVEVYDGPDSVDMSSVLQVAINEGLVERAGPLISFTHDMILKAAMDSIHEDDRIPLLRKLIKVLIQEASASGSLDSVLFVAVDLINRIGSEFTTVSKERALFAELNLRAATEAVAVPDFSGAAVYAENGISFLSVTCWETQYELCIRLYEISVLSLFPSLTGDRRKLMQRIKDIFEHVRDFSDKFKTHMVWVQLLAASDLARAIDECLNALVQLGESFDFETVDYDLVSTELVKQKEHIKPSDFLATKRLVDMNKIKAMKVMSLLLHLYQQRKSHSAALVSCKMVELSMKHGTCEESVHGVAAFAAAMKNILGFIDEGGIWGRTALSLLKLFGDKPSLIPPVYAEVYGSDLLVAEPIQSTLEPLSLCLRFAVETGNEFAFTNSVYYLLKSFGSGKNLKVLIDEVFICVRQFGCHLGNDSSFKTPSYNLFIQFFFTPLYNVLRGFEESNNILSPGCEEASFPFQAQLVDNYSVLKAAMDLERFNFVLMILTVQTPMEFMSRNMDMALKCSQMYFEHFLVGDKPTSMLSGSVPNIFYNGLINFYFMRQTGDERYKVHGEKALNKLNEWSAYSEWNFKHKQLLLKAEFHYSMKNTSMAATCYEASIKAAHEHKFIHEEAIANELAGRFFLGEGQREMSLLYFKQSSACYRAWGAFTIAKRVDAFTEKEFSTM